MSRGLMYRTWVLVLVLWPASNSSYANNPFVFEIALGVKTSHSAVSSAALMSNIGLGFSHDVTDFTFLLLGYGAKMSLYPRLRQGTDVVYSRGFNLETELRGFISMPWRGTMVKLFPYFYVSPHVGMEFRQNRVFENASNNYHVDAGLRGGGGIGISFLDVVSKLEGDVGISIGGFNFRASIIFGFGIF